MTDDQREKDIDRLIEDIQAEKQARGSERPPSVPGQPGPGDQLTEERKAKVSGFRLQLDLDEEYGDPPPADPAPAVPEAEILPWSRSCGGRFP